MGYCYGRNERGNMVLACDGCSNVGGVRKRTCPYKVRDDASRSTVPGTRYEMRYCYPPALCAVCYAKRGGQNGVHANCAAGAARSQAEYDTSYARLVAGEYKVMSAFGSWHDAVPAGKTGVIFRNLDGDERTYLVDADEYEPGPKGWLADYPDAQPVEAFA